MVTFDDKVYRLNKGMYDPKDSSFPREDRSRQDDEYYKYKKEYYDLPPLESGSTTPRESETGYSEARRNVDRSDFDTYKQYKSNEELKRRERKHGDFNKRYEKYVADPSSKGIKKARDLPRFKKEGTYGGEFDETEDKKTIPQGNATTESRESKFYGGTINIGDQEETVGITDENREMGGGQYQYTQERGVYNNRLETIDEGGKFQHQKIGGVSSETTQLGSFENYRLKNGEIETKDDYSELSKSARKRTGLPLRETHHFKGSVEEKKGRRNRFFHSEKEGEGKRYQGTLVRDREVENQRDGYYRTVSKKEGSLSPIEGSDAESKISSKSMFDRFRSNQGKGFAESKKGMGSQSEEIKNLDMSDPDEEISIGDNPKTGKTEKIYTVKDSYGRIHTVEEKPSVSFDQVTNGLRDDGGFDGKGRMRGKGTRKHTIRTSDGSLVSTTTEEGDFKNGYLHGENSKVTVKNEGQFGKPKTTEYKGPVNYGRLRTNYQEEDLDVETSGVMKELDKKPTMKATVTTGGGRSLFPSQKKTVTINPDDNLKHPFFKTTDTSSKTYAPVETDFSTSKGYGSFLDVPPTDLLGAGQTSLNNSSNLESDMSNLFSDSNSSSFNTEIQDAEDFL